MEIKDLKGNDLLLVSAKGANGGKVQLMFAQKIANPNLRPQSIVGALNASDSRFTVEDKPRYAWHSGEPADIKAALGIDVSGLTVGQEMPINKLNPTIGGQKLNIQITETTDGDDYDYEHLETRAKRAGKDGDFIVTAGGKYIFVKSDVVRGEAKHVFFSDTQRMPAGASTAEDAVADAIGN